MNQLFKCIASGPRNSFLRRQTVPQNGDIRLVDQFGFIGSSSGRLEIFISVWGTICDTGFDVFDADVVCMQLGFLYSNRVGSVLALG